ncbi:hypothetical protein [Methylobacter sp. YRD-M1]|uniref:hypothetical protein n=1 Tax=Methylobacter sp. YRD-M1 TaxID=2911520 RepID=UPI00227D0345|nr:hypothetical protein [Methylobacter sp. YRD-M1]WAK00527.1 hypothetical protein LZ558_11755 [Methylobacter sp. YRD-M1]
MLISISIANAHADEDESPAPEPESGVGVMSEEVARARVFSAGYGEIQSIERIERYYVIRTVRDGHPVLVKIDVMTGEMIEVR